MIRRAELEAVGALRRRIAAVRSLGSLAHATKQGNARLQSSPTRSW